MKINLLTAFPEYFNSTICSILKRALNQNLWQLNIINIRDYGLTKHKNIDDTPYGGGTGMVMRADVLGNAIEENKLDKNPIFITSPRGRIFNQSTAREMSKLQDFTIITNRFEGVDQRAIEYFNIQEISLGEFITLGGESICMCIIESIVRLIPNVIKEDATTFESFSKESFIEHHHYTKPQVWKDIEIPKVLYSGDHKKIELWRDENSKENLENFKKKNTK
jgi:tRNA (guanine37-N1)-methyltransferase